MMGKKMIGIGVALSGLGAAILALLMVPVIAQSNLSISNYSVQDIIIWIGSGFIIFGIVIIGSGVILFILRAISLSAIKAIELTDGLNFFAKPASEADLKLIHQMAFDYFEGDVSPLDRMLDWQRHNPKVFWILRREGQSENKINGYFCVIPLKKESAKLIQKEKIKGSEFITEHITSGRYNSKPYALYIGAVAASGLFAKAAALSQLYQYLQHLKDRKVVNVYTRPVTKDGLRICKKRKFRPVDTKVTESLNRVHYLNLNEV